MNIYYRYIPDVIKTALGEDRCWFSSNFTNAYAEIHRTSRNYYLVMVCDPVKKYMFQISYGSLKECFNKISEFFSDVHKRL